MTVTRVSNYAYESFGPWVVAFFIALILIGILAFIIFGPETNPGGATKGEVIFGASFLGIAFPLALAGVMSIINLLTPVASLYEGTVTKVPDPVKVSHYPVVIATMEGSEVPLYVINREEESTVEKVVPSEDPQAFLCEPRSMGRGTPTLLMCDALDDKPGSEAIEKLKAEGV